jgi:hypothetical protein
MDCEVSVFEGLCLPANLDLAEVHNLDRPVKQDQFCRATESGVV